MSSIILRVAAAAATTAVVLAAAPAPPPHTDRPVIGILTTPLADGDCVTRTGPPLHSPLSSSSVASAESAASCFDNVYVKWVEAAGARVVPVRFDSPAQELDRLFDSLNGILFTGGGTDLSDLGSPYLQAAGHLLNRTIDAFVSKGDYVPVWGTCMGIQTLSLLVAQDPSVVVSGFVGVDPLSMPLDLTIAATSSKLFGSLPATVVDAVSRQPLTTNLHHDGMTPQIFADNHHLSAFFDVLSTNEDGNGKPFVSTIEGKTVPVWGVQWHPERPQFEWHKTDPATGVDPVNHDGMAILAMQSFANFFVGESRGNNHSFESEAALAAEVIYNYKSVGNTDYQAYFFPASNSNNTRINKKSE